MKLLFTYRLAELIDNQKFHSETFKESMAALGIAMETRTLKPLHKPMQLQPYQIIAVNWMVVKEKRLVKGGKLADDCRTSKVRSCCALDI
jgi:SNF2 family DNA or RNA helicase